MSKYDWQDLNDQLAKLADLEGKPFESITQVSKVLGIPYGTVYDAFQRGDLSHDFISVENNDLNMGKLDGFSFNEYGNEAVLKFKSAKPISAKEATEIAGIDTSEWRIVDQTIKMWQMGRKAKDIDLVWEGGRMEGHVRDEGKINKTYLYGIEIKLTRVNRIPTKLKTLSPIELKFRPRVIFNTPPIHTAAKVLFITDPHFGFRRNEFGKLVPIHNRNFIGSLLAIADEVKPDVTIWNGDVLDLADFSSFDTAPELLHTTQMAGLELAWILGEFRNQSRRQIVIEGNHERRMKNMLIKHFSASYQLKPVHELGGEPLMSVPRFLGLDKLHTEWVDGYPTGHVKINTAKFYHGDIVRKGSAKTIASIMPDAAGDKFFGHIHRFEIATKYVEDLERNIWVGSPGCACNKEKTPGADIGHNWQLGAFLVHAGRKAVLGVEHIWGESGNAASFRGRDITPVNYLENFLDEIPEQYRGQY